MDKIIYNIASYKRGDTLVKTIESIYNQCDIINIALNDYDEIPVELYDKKINIFLGDNEKGDAYKYYDLINSDGYYFTIDDDLIYPENYSEYMIGKIEEYNRNSIITIHGRSFNNFPIKSYYNSPSNLYHFNQILNQDVKIQFGGTGVMAFHTDLFKLDIEYFKEPNMADVWIGKYANENNIDVICVKHNSGFVRQQKTKETIFDNQAKSDLKQTIITNNSFSEKNVSIIVPTFDNVDYIDECLNSIINSCINIGEFEILVGIDNCEKTLEYVSKNKFHPSIKFYYFLENVGPYIIKNTLANNSKSNNIIFFDSDDVMKKNMVNIILEDLKHYECVKPMYHNFYNIINETDPKYNKNSGLWGEGVFGIKKDYFLKFNGFEGWRCAADSDFMARIQKNSVRMSLTKEMLFYRRIHNKGLTSDSKTNYGSDLRKHYVKLSREKTNFGALDELKISDFSVIHNKLDFTNVNLFNENQKIISKTIETNNTINDVIKKLDVNSEIKIIDSKHPEVKKYVNPVEEKVIKPEPILEFKTDNNISNNNIKETVLSLVNSNSKIVRTLGPNTNKDNIINKRIEQKPIKEPINPIDKPKIKRLNGKFGFNI